MKKSLYNYFFDDNDRHIAYSWLSDDYLELDMSEKKRFHDILNKPDNIYTQRDTDIYKEAVKRKFIIPDNFDEFKYIIDKRHAYIAREDILSLTILPTLSCNLNCSYCYETHPKLSESYINDDTFNNLKILIDSKIHKLSYLTLGWFGGEPLLKADQVIDFSRYCIDLCNKNDVLFNSSMTTNALLLTKEMAQKISDCKIHTLQISIDGFKEWHDQVRITKKPTYDKIIENIYSYLDADESNLVVLRIHFPHNSNEKYLENVFAFIDTIVPCYRKKIYVNPQVIFTFDDKDPFAHVTCNSRNEYLSESSHSIMQIARFSDGIKDHGFNSMRSKTYREYVACYAELNWFWAITPEGYLNKCTVQIEKINANARLTPKGISHFNDKLFTYREKDFDGSFYRRCGKCGYLPICWQECPAQTPANRFTKCKNPENSVAIMAKLKNIISNYHNKSY